MYSTLLGEKLTVGSHSVPDERLRSNPTSLRNASLVTTLHKEKKKHKNPIRIRLIPNSTPLSRSKKLSHVAGDRAARGRRRAADGGVTEAVPRHARGVLAGGRRVRAGGGVLVAAAEEGDQAPHEDAAQEVAAVGQEAPPHAVPAAAAPPAGLDARRRRRHRRRGGGERRGGGAGAGAGRRSGRRGGGGAVRRRLTPPVVSLPCGFFTRIVDFLLLKSWMILLNGFLLNF